MGPSSLCFKVAHKMGVANQFNTKIIGQRPKGFTVPQSNHPPKIMLLGSGELGKEVAICAQRYGCTVVAVDNYAHAPAMQVADEAVVLDMLDGRSLKKAIRKHQPDHVVPEVEAIRTEALLEIEASGINVIPSANAAHLTMNRDAIRSLAAEELGLPTARYAYASSESELVEAVVSKVGLPCVIKPVMSSSGKGQSVARTKNDLKKCWKHALAGMRGDTPVVIVEEFVKFDSEITLLTVKQRPEVAAPSQRTIFVPPIGHRQERGDYQESWIPHPMNPSILKKAQRMAKKVTDRLAGPTGAGLFGVEFFIRGEEVIFSELSPRPHDTGMVTMISQQLSEFELHLRAILGLPISNITVERPSASAVILACRAKVNGPKYHGLAEALKIPETEIRIFGKPNARKWRRMGVALAQGKTLDQARKRARKAAASIRVS